MGRKRTGQAAKQPVIHALIFRHPRTGGNIADMGIVFACGTLVILQALAENSGADLFILPSSIHEVLVMKVDGEINAGELQYIVMDINRHMVEGGNIADMGIVFACGTLVIWV
mgnify:CR=1 FL=1